MVGGLERVSHICARMVVDEPGDLVDLPSSAEIC